MSAFGSIPLIFIVDGHEYFVHADLLFEHSAPLYTMITTSGMRESQEKVATLDGVSRKTFERFLEWVYKGFYTAAEPIEEAAPELPAPPDPEVEPSAFEALSAYDTPAPADDFDLPSQTAFAKKKKKKAADNAVDWGMYRSPTPPGTVTGGSSSAPYAAFRSSVPVPPVRKNKSMLENYTDIFLCHAELYVFADERLIENLKVLALETLDETLRLFKLYPNRVGDIVNLIEYVYDHTATSNTTETEPMRALMMNFIARETKCVMRDARFRALLDVKGGDLMPDFLDVMEKKM